MVLLPFIDSLSPRLEVGKASPGFKQGAAIGYAGTVVEVIRPTHYTCP